MQTICHVHEPAGTPRNQQDSFRDADRSQGSLLSAAERRCLVFLARRLPPWINSDHLTALGAVSLLGAGLSYWYASRSPVGLMLATIFLVLNWLGDSLDGTLARVRNRLRPRYGFYVDHILDTFGAFFLLGGIGLSGYMHPWFAAGLLVAYLMLSIEVYLATYTIGTFHLSHWKLSPTELRILLAAGNIALMFQPAGRLFDIGGIIGIIGMAAMLLTAAVRHAALLYRQEQIR
jgi:phosphatidylglycerophosphate synthase